MKSAYILIIFSIFMIAQVLHAGEKETVRVVSWNIAYGKDFKEVAAGMKILNADIYLLQEVDLKTKRSGFLDIAESLAKELGYNFIWTEEFQELRQDKKGQPAFTGQAILSRYPLRLLHELRFQHEAAKWTPHVFHPRSWTQPRRGGRVAQFVEVNIGGQNVILCNTHLESSVADKKKAPQMKEILDYIATNLSNLPTIIAGDLNTSDGLSSPVVGLTLEAGFRDILISFYEPEKRPSTIPKKYRLLDWIFVNDEIEVLSARVAQEINGSDHYPLFAEMKLR